MKYAEAVEFLSTLVDHERQSPLARDLTLEPVRRLLTALGNPQDSLFIVHVAGTNGKGSVASMLEMILRRAGYRTGLYTSPDLGGFDERFRVNGTPIRPAAFSQLVARIATVVAADRSRNEWDQLPTKFDVATALAFLYFAVSRVDVAIVEVGMGGRHDSTNVCTPQVSVITSISYDHTRQLGGTLQSIAMEKAGIIKTGHPTISGVTCEEARIVVENTCRDIDSCLSQLGVDFSYRYVPGELTHSTLTPPRTWITIGSRLWPVIPLSLHGEHQAANAAVTVATVEKLRDLGLYITDKVVIDALSQARCPARIEIVSKRPLVILDCAHNTASAEMLLSTLRTSFPEHFGPRMRLTAKRRLIFGGSRDKDLSKIMAIIGADFQHVYLTRYSQSTRSASKDELLTAIRASQVDVSTTYVSDAVKAWELAESEAGADDVICITGSIFLAGEIRAFLSGRQRYSLSLSSVT